MYMYVGVEAASSKNLEKEETDVVKGKEQGHIFGGIAEGESSGSCGKLSIIST